MSRNFAVLLVGLLLVPQLTTGCRSATEPSSTDAPLAYDAYAGWVGSWLGTDTRHQVSVLIWAGLIHDVCVGGPCWKGRDLEYSANITDAANGSSATYRSTFDTEFPLDGFEIVLGSRFETDEVRGSVLTHTTFKGTLQGTRDATGTVVVKRRLGSSPYTEISTDTFALTLRKQ